MSKPLPPLATDEEAEAFVADADLSGYDLSGGRFVQYAFDDTSTEPRLRLPQRLADSLKSAAEQAGLSTDQHTRRALESAAKAEG